MKTKFFLIRLPNNEELLYKCNSWTGMTCIVPYIAGEYADLCYMRPLNMYEVIKFLLGGNHANF